MQQSEFGKVRARRAREKLQTFRLDLGEAETHQVQGRIDGCTERFVFRGRRFGLRRECDVQYGGRWGVADGPERLERRRAVPRWVDDGQDEVRRHLLATVRIADRKPQFEFTP